MNDLSADEIQRYARQLNVMGREGQARLKAASVLCLGAGGLGSPVALYLAAAGIGRIGIVDDDRVDLSNLHRQILHGTSDVGRAKVESAQERLHALNPEISLEIHQARFTAANAADLVSRYEVIVDGSDNLATRYLSSDICVWQRKANIYGSVHQFEGQVSVFAPHLGAPCYRCLFPEPPPPEAVPSCAEAGVLGVLPGIIGTLQALEAIKLLLGLGETLAGRLLHFDGLRHRFREFKIRRDPNCPVCGDAPRILAPIDYEQFCGAGATNEIPSMTATELQARLEQSVPTRLIDVREPFEFEIARINGSELFPLGEMADWTSRISRDDTAVLICKSGVRSAHAIDVLQEQGFRNLWNLEGGIDAWRRLVDPALPKY